VSRAVHGEREAGEDREPEARSAAREDELDGDEVAGPPPWARMNDRAVRAEVDRSPATMERATSGAGAAVPYRGEMERAFGEDFGGVRAHLGQAGAMGEMGAVAAARGDDVAFASAVPDRGEVAHELAHVVQQRRGGPVAVAPLALEPEDSPAEREAEAAAAAFADPDRAGARIAIGASRAGRVARAFGGTPSPPKANAHQWLARYLQELAPSIRRHLAGARIPAGHPRLKWSIDGGEIAGQVWYQLAPTDLISSVMVARDLERMAPGLWKRIDEVRPIDPPDPKKPGEPQGPFEYVDEVAIVLARDLEKLIASATTRLGPRLVAAMDASPHAVQTCDARDVSILTADSVVTSHPIDTHVLDILGIAGTASIESAMSAGPDPSLDHVAAVGPSGLRPVTYEWVADPSMWSWIRVTPADAAPEEVALTLLGDTERASELKASPPFFSLPPRVVKKLAPERSDLAIARFKSIGNPMKVFDEIDVVAGGVPTAELATSAVGEEAGLAQAARLDAPVVDPRAAAAGGAGAADPATATAFIEAPELAERCQAQIALIGERFPSFEAPKALAVMADRLEDRRARLVELPPVELLRFATLFRAQSGVLVDVTAELQILDTQARRIRDAQIAANPNDPPADVDPQVRQLARDVLAAGAIADLPETAREKIAAVRQQRDGAMFDTLDAMLGDTRGALRASDPVVYEHGPDPVDAKNLAIQGDLEVRQANLASQVLAARRRHAAGQSDPRELETLQLQVRAAQLESRLVTGIAHSHYVKQRVVGEMGVLANITYQDVDLREANQRLLALWSDMLALREHWLSVRDPLFAQHAANASQAGDVEGTIQEKIAEVELRLRRLGDDNLRKTLEFAQNAIEDAQTAKAVFEIALMVGLTLVTSGIGSMAAGAARGLRLGRLAVAAADIGAQSVSMATFRSAIFGDSFVDSLGTELVTNFAGFAALRGIAHALPRLKFAKTLSAWKEGDDVWKYVAHGTELTIEAATQAGLQFAMAEAESLIRQGRFLDETELKRLAIQGMGMFVGNAVAHRLARPVMNQLSAYGARVGAPFRRSQVEALAEQVKATGEPEKAAELLREDRALIAEEIELYKRIAADKTEVAAIGGEATLAVLRGQAEAHIGKVREMTVEHSAQHHLDEIAPGSAWTGSPDQVHKVRADAIEAGATVKERLGPDGEIVHEITADGRTFELREKTPTPTGHEHKPGVYDNVDKDLETHVNPDGETIRFMDDPDEIEPAPDGDWTVKQTIVEYTAASGDQVHGMLNRAYRRRDDGSVEIQLRQIDMIGIPSMTGVSHPLGDAGTRTTAYAQMRQMQQFGVGAGEVTRVTMEKVQAIETLCQLEAARRRFGLGYDQLDRVLPRTKSIEYAGTPLAQAGHRIKSATMTGGKLRTMGDMIKEFEEKPQTHEAAQRIAQEYGIRPEDEVWTDFNIEIELEKGP
jgi:hypothetical protein